MNDVAMAEHRTLGPPCRARGVEDHGGVFFADLDRRCQRRVIGQIRKAREFRVIVDRDPVRHIGNVARIGHAIGQRWVYDQRYGVALARKFYHNKPPSILDVPVHMDWAAVELPDPETPVGARGIGEPPVAAGCSAVLNAISAAVGDEVFVRTPVTLDHIVTALEMGRPTQARLTANV